MAERRTGRAVLRPSPFAWLVVAIALLAFGIRLALLLRGAGLTGYVGYDDGVHYAAAAAFVHGRLPYRDFLFLQPPGILLFLCPFAALGSVLGDPAGLAAARLACFAVGGLNAALMAVYARRFGGAAGIVAGVGYAVFAPAVFAERGVLLEPLGTAGILGALVLATRAAESATARPRQAAALAGVAGAWAAGIKIWYVVPLLVLLAFQRRQRLGMLLGTAAGGLALYLPFLAGAPAAMVREVVLDQLGRPRHPDWTLPRRLGNIVGLPTGRLPPVLQWIPPGTVAVALLAFTLVLAVATATVRGARVVPVLLLMGVAVLLATPVYFPHYVALTAPWSVLVAAIGSVRIGAALSPRPAAGRAFAALSLGVLALLSFDPDLGRVGVPVPAAALAPAARAVRCTMTDDPAVLAALGVLSADLARGCPLWPDVTGWTYDRDRGYGPGIPKELGRRENGPWQRDAVTYLTSGDAVILHRTATGLDRASLAVLARGRVLARSGRWVLRAVER